MHDYTVGDRVVFRGHWPWLDHTGVVLSVVAWPRLSGQVVPHVIVHWFPAINPEIPHASPYPIIQADNPRLERLPHRQVCTACLRRPPAEKDHYCVPCGDNLREMVDEYHTWRATQ